MWLRGEVTPGAGEEGKNSKGGIKIIGKMFIFIFFYIDIIFIGKMLFAVKINPSTFFLLCKLIFLFILKFLKRLISMLI